MPRYYFDVRKDGDDEPDSVGTELASLDLVPALALALALEIAREALPGLTSIIVCVRGGEPHPLYKASLDLAGQWALRSEMRG